jgi:lysophospholipase L1-like esterase
VRKLKLALSILAVVTILLALLEAGARLRYPEPPTPAWRMHPLMGFARPARFKAPKIAIDTNLPFTLETNALGLRSTTLDTIAKPAGVYRIVFVGGSTTENGDLPHEHTFPGIVEETLKGRGVEVANAGIPGATTNAVLAQLVHRVLPLQPDLVLCLDPALNDFHESLKDEWDPAMAYLAADPPAPRFSDWLAGQSRFLSLFNSRNAELANAREMLDRRVQKRREKPILDPKPQVLRRGLSHFEEVQRIILEVCRDEKVACGLLTEPTLLKANLSKQEDDVIASTAIVGTDYNLEPGTELAALETYNDVTRANARAFGALLIDGAKFVPKDLDHYVDDVHLTTRGNQVIADAILEAIAPIISR